MEIILLGPGDGDKAAAAAPLFDHEPKPEAVQHFLTQPTHHILVAYEEEVPVGFVTGVEMTHPDKGTEMFLYELGVAEGYRRRGIGGSLVQRLADMARSRGCYGMWVGTDPTNAAALATYQRAGASRDQGEVITLSWRFDDS